ncbi:NADPH-dependent FMN reductase family protein [Bacteroides mediterraneensis]|uniref:hypothetical protein n=1 Tax=Bacteroides mediterraneensis TaxID=1841856 RepID=UPI000934162C|nr:hypothetical protein [Bacteroides mediterraneensis]
MKATVLYYSHKGKTAFFAREIAMYLWSKGLHVSLCAISDFDPQKLAETDFLLSGCWTCGCFVVGQHPHRQWKACSRRMAGQVPSHRTLLFTTYKFRTGSMLRNMKKTLRISRKASVPFLQSKNGLLTDSDKQILDRFITV